MQSAPHTAAPRRTHPPRPPPPEVRPRGRWSARPSGWERPPQAKLPTNPPAGGTPSGASPAREHHAGNPRPSRQGACAASAKHQRWGSGAHPRRKKRGSGGTPQASPRQGARPHTPAPAWPARASRRCLVAAESDGGLKGSLSGTWSRSLSTLQPRGGFGCSRRTGGAGAWCWHVPRPARCCGWGLPVLVLVCAGYASLNPRGGLRLVPHGCGVGCVVVGGWGSAAAHAYDEVCTAGNKVGWWLRESSGGIGVGVRRCAVGVVNTQGSKPGCRFCAVWPRQRQGPFRGQTGRVWGTRPARGLPRGLLQVVPFVENPDRRGHQPRFSNPLRQHRKSAGRGGRGGAPGRAATTVSAQAPKA